MSGIVLLFLAIVGLNADEHVQFDQQWCDQVELRRVAIAAPPSTDGCVMNAADAGDLDAGESGACGEFKGLVGRCLHKSRRPARWGEGGSEAGTFPTESIALALAGAIGGSRWVTCSVQAAAKRITQGIFQSVVHILAKISGAILDPHAPAQRTTAHPNIVCVDMYARRVRISRAGKFDGVFGSIKCDVFHGLAPVVAGVGFVPMTLIDNHILAGRLTMSRALAKKSKKSFSRPDTDRIRRQNDRD